MSIGQRDVAADRLDRLEVHGEARRSLSAIIASTEPSSAQPTMSSIDLRRVWLGRHLLEEEPGEARVVAPPVVPVELRPALVGRQLVVERRTRPRYGCGGDRRGTPTANATMPRTRSGRSAANWIARPDRRRRTARRGRRARSRWRPARPRGRSTSRSPAYAAGIGRAIGSAVAAPVVGDDPVVTGSGKWIWPFHWREWTIGVDGSSTSVGSPVAEDVVREPDAVDAVHPARLVGGAADVQRSRVAAVRVPSSARPESPRTKSRISRLTRTGSRAWTR